MGRKPLVSRRVGAQPSQRVYGTVYMGRCKVIQFIHVILSATELKQPARGSLSRSLNGPAGQAPRFSLKS